MTHWSPDPINARLRYTFANMYCELTIAVHERTVIKVSLLTENTILLNVSHNWLMWSRLKVILYTDNNVMEMSHAG